MRKSIATVSLSGTLADKLAAAARAGFDGVELFENDLVTCPARPEEIRGWAQDRGLAIDLYQPFRDLEAVPGEQFRRNLDRAERKLDLMTRLGATTLLVCSNTSEAAIPDDGLAAAQLHQLAERAAQRGIRVAYEALAWGRHVNTYRHADAVAAAADHPHLGVCLDSFHILSRGDDPAGIAAIPGERIFYLQLADAPDLRMDVLQWSRHYRCFPGQGGFDLAGFLEHVLAAGYRGPLSLEVFNDTFRQADADRTAVDAMRSLLFLEASLRARLSRSTGGDPSGRPAALLDQVEVFDPPAPPGLGGLEFVEVAAGGGQATATERLLDHLGFTRAGRHRTKPVTHWRQGDVHLLLSRLTTGGPDDHSRAASPELAGLGIRSSDPARSATRAQALRAPLLPRRRGPGEADLPTIRAPGGTLLQFCENATWQTDFTPPTGTAAPTDAGGPAETDAGGAGPAPGLTRIDHVNLALPFDQFDEGILFFRAVLGLQPHEPLDLPDPYGLVRSRALTDPDQTVRLALNLPQLRPGTACALGAGTNLQHVAFACDDLVALTRALRARGLRGLVIPDNYYDDLAARWALPGDRLATLRELGLLYDRSPAGEYLHTYTEMLGDRLFLELVQRTGGYAGYGAGNAPVRLATQRARTSSR